MQPSPLLSRSPPLSLRLSPGVRLTGLLEPSPSAASQLQRFLTGFHSSNSPPPPSADDSSSSSSSSVTGVTFVVNGVAFEAFIEGPTDALFALMQLIRRHARAAPPPSSAQPSKASTRPSTTKALPLAPSSPLLPSSPATSVSALSPHSHGIASLKVLSFVEEVPRTFSFFALRAVRQAASPEDWPNPSPSYGAAVGGGGGVGPSTLGAPPHAASGMLALTFGTLQGMLALGAQVAAMGAEGEEWLLSGGGRALTEKVVTVERVMGYGGCGELMDADDFLDTFVRRSDGKPESEQVWPVDKYIAV